MYIVTYSVKTSCLYKTFERGNQNYCPISTNFSVEPMRAVKLAILVLGIINFLAWTGTNILLIIIFFSRLGVN